MSKPEITLKGIIEWLDKSPDWTISRGGGRLAWLMLAWVCRELVIFQTGLMAANADSGEAHFEEILFEQNIPLDQFQRVMARLEEALQALGEKVEG